MAAKKKRELYKKVIHVFHVIVEFLMKFKKAIGKSPVKEPLAKSGKLSTKSILNPIHVVTKSFASLGVTVSSSTATALLVGTVIIVGSAVAYESDPDFFSKQLSDSLTTPINSLISENQGKLGDLVNLGLDTLLNGVNTTQGPPSGLNSTNNPQIGIGIVNPNVNPEKRVESPKTSEKSVSTKKEPDNVKLPSKSEPISAYNGETDNYISNEPITAFPIDFEIPG